jgi:hypothetical protein
MPGWPTSLTSTEHHAWNDPNPIQGGLKFRNDIVVFSDHPVF